MTKFSSLPLIFADKPRYVSFLSPLQLIAHPSPHLHFSL